MSNNKAPTKALKIMVRVFPADLKTLTIASMAANVPVKKFQSLKIIQANQIPNNNDMYTCLVLNAKMIATTGGKIDRNP